VTLFLSVNDKNCQAGKVECIMSGHTGRIHKIIFRFDQKFTKSSIAVKSHQENSISDMSASLETGADILQSPRLCLDNHSGTVVVASWSHYDQVPTT
jgi:hypothetical protein